MATGYDLFISAANHVQGLTGDEYPVRFVEFHRESFSRRSLAEAAFCNELRKMLVLLYTEKVVHKDSATAVDLRLKIAVFLMHPILRCELFGTDRVRTPEQEGACLAAIMADIVRLDRHKYIRKTRKFPKNRIRSLVTNFICFSMDLLGPGEIQKTPIWPELQEPVFLHNLRLLLDHALPLLEKTVPVEVATEFIAFISSKTTSKKLKREQVLALTWSFMRHVKHIA